MAMNVLWEGVKATVGIVGQAAVETGMKGKLQADLLLISHEIENRKRAFGEELYEYVVRMLYQSNPREGNLLLIWGIIFLSCVNTPTLQKKHSTAISQYMFLSSYCYYYHNHHHLRILLISIHTYIHCLALPGTALENARLLRGQRSHDGNAAGSAFNGPARSCSA